MPALSAYESTLQELLDAAVADRHIPGAVVGIARGDERSVVASGVANVRTGVLTTPDTLFQVGSISKVYTATLVMQLVHAGLVELDEPVRGALQEFRVGDDTATLTITPRQLLSHTSGIQGDHFLDCGRNPDAMWRYVSTLEDVGQIHEPDDMFSYCNAGYGVLGRLIEEATGDHFVRALQRRLLRPLALKRTCAYAEQAIVHRVAAGHQWRDDEHRVMPWMLSAFNIALGGLLANADDILDFALVHARGGKSLDGKQIMPTRAVAEMAEPQIDVPGGSDEWGLGWQISHWGDTDVVGHGGDTIGQRSQLVVLPESDAAVVILTNSPHGTQVIDDVLARLGRDLLDAVPPAPPPVLEATNRDVVAWANGVYERMHQRLAIAGADNGTLKMTIIPDEVFAAAGLTEQTVTLEPIDADRFLTHSPESGSPAVVTMHRGDDGRPDYVHYGLRAHARIS